MDMLILVDINDKPIGYEEKEKCHLIPMKLHRAFSVFIFNSKGQMLVQKRSAEKKTWPGFWANACCSHPRKGEELEAAAKRRLKEELGIACRLNRLFAFEYKADYDKKWGEHELDHVFVGRHDGPFLINKNEVAEWKFADIRWLRTDMKKNPDKYTPWFKIAFEKVVSKI